MLLLVRPAIPHAFEGLQDREAGEKEQSFSTLM